MALRVPPVAQQSTALSSRRSALTAAAFSIVVPARTSARELYTAASDCTSTAVCTGNGKTQLASYDEMLLKRTTDELCAATKVHT